MAYLYQLGSNEPLKEVPDEIDEEAYLQQRIAELEDALRIIKARHYAAHTYVKSYWYCNECTRAEGIYTPFPCEAYKRIEDVLSGVG